MLQKMNSKLKTRNSIKVAFTAATTTAAGTQHYRAARRSLRLKYRGWPEGEGASEAFATSFTSFAPPPWKWPREQPPRSTDADADADA